MSTALVDVNNRVVFVLPAQIPTAQVPSGLTQITIPAGVTPSQGWIVSNNGATFTDPTQPTLANQKQFQYQIINQACAAAIASGFTSSALGSANTYQSDVTNQTNILGATSLAGGGNLSIMTNGVWTPTPHTQLQSQQVLADFQSFKSALQTQCSALCAKLQAATTIAAVTAIVWAMPTLPGAATVAASASGSAYYPASNPNGFVNAAGAVAANAAAISSAQTMATNAQNSISSTQTSAAAAQTAATGAQTAASAAQTASAAAVAQVATVSALAQTAVQPATGSTAFRIWPAKTVTAADGSFTVDYTAANFKTAAFAFFQPIVANPTCTTLPTVTPGSVSLTSTSGIVSKPGASVSVAGSTVAGLQVAAANVTVQVFVIGY